MASRYRPHIIAAALVAAAAAGYGTFWFIEAGVVKNGLADWTAGQRAQGFTIAYGTPRLSGFPFSIVVHLDQPSITAPGKDWRWTGEAVEADVRPWAFRHVTVHPLGRQEVGLVRAGATALASASAAKATAIVDVDERGRLTQGSFDAEDLSLEAAGAAAAVSVHAFHLTLAGIRGAAVPAAGPALAQSAALSLELEGITLPAAEAGPLGPKLGPLTAEAQLRGPLDGKGPIEALKAWRDAGGTLELRHFALDWGPLQISGNATLALDPNLQPEGAGTGEIRGFAETVDALVGQGLVKPDAGALAKAAFGLIAKSPPGGGAKVLSIPLSIQRQTLFAGPFGLMKVPTIKWSG